MNARTWALWTPTLALVAALVGCSADPAPGGACVGATCRRDSGVARDSGRGTPTSNVDGGGSVVVGDSGRPTTSNTGPDSGTVVNPGGGSGLPCEVQRIVVEKCSLCHGDPPAGTFMSLLSYADFHAASTSDPSRDYYELTTERINASSDPMPPVTQPALTAAEKATLNAWLQAGAPRSTEACSTPDGGTVVPPRPEEIDTTGLECFRMLAHANGNKNAPFQVGIANDAYYNMAFRAPWQGTVYGVVVKPITDNAQVLHHWLLFKDPSGGADGSVAASSGAHSGGEMVYGWAPGGLGLDFRARDNTGFELPATTYVMEFHYNSSDPAALDASGAEICVLRTPPTHVASLSWLGLDWGYESYIAGAFLGGWASGNCASPSDRWVGTCVPRGGAQPIHILNVTPHMHETGTHMRAVINQVGGGTRVLYDGDFDFNYQLSYNVDEVLAPGETITTTCTYSEPQCSGQATGAEMCYLFTYAYPAGALADNGRWGSIAHGEGACLGQ